MSKPNLPKNWNKKHVSGKSPWDKSSTSTDPAPPEENTPAQNAQTGPAEESIPSGSSFSEQLPEVSQHHEPVVSVSDNDIPSVLDADKHEKKAMTPPVYPKATVYDERQVSADHSGSSNKTVVVLLIVLIIVLLTFGALGFLYLSKSGSFADKQDPAPNTNVSISTDVTSIDAQNTISTESTVTLSSSTTTVSDSTSSAVSESNISKYVGYWHIHDNQETELTISSIGDNYADMALWMYRICSFEDIHTELTDEKGTFSASSDQGYISGNISFLDQSIVIELTDCDVAGLGSHSELFFSERSDRSIQEASSNNGVISELPVPVYGQIIGSGSVIGYDSSYICNGGPEEVVRKDLRAGWHIVSSRSCVNYGKTWYECYDSDDGDHYGWISEDYLELDRQITPYLLKINNPELSIYDSPSYSANVVGVIKDKGTYTIDEEYMESGEVSPICKWGKLHSGVGWINLSDAILDVTLDGFTLYSSGNIQGRVVTKDDELNVRESPSTSSEKIGTVAKNQLVDIIGETTDWFIINYKGGYGFVSAEYIELIS